MCDKETRTRLERIELQTVGIATDVKWLKKLIGGVLIIILAFFGFDVTTMV